jgi:hypothetical protein
MQIEGVNMQFKRLGITFIFLLLCVSMSVISGVAQTTSATVASTAASTTTSTTNVVTGLSEGSSVQVSLSNQNPDAARPGEPVELTFTVQNVGNNNLRAISVAVVPTNNAVSLYPFSQLTGEPLVQNIPYLNARQDPSDSSVLKFDLMTDANAADGTYNVDVLTTATTDDDNANVVRSENTFQITVRGKEYAQVVTISKSNIDVGKVNLLQFVITNTGNSPLQNMVFSWKDPQNIILPILSDNTKYIKYLAANQSVTVDYSVMADVNANPGLYPINMNLTFENYESQQQTIFTTAGLFVGGSTDFDVSYSESAQGQISLAVANVGDNMAEAVKVSIPRQQGYTVIGSPSIIIGNLQKGDYTIASFTVNDTTGFNASSASRFNANNPVNAGNDSNFSSESNPLKVQIDYTDPQGNRQTLNKEVVVPAGGLGSFVARSRTGNNNSSSNNNLIYGAIGVVVIIVAVYFYRKRKQNSKKLELTTPTESQPKQ